MVKTVCFTPKNRSLSQSTRRIWTFRPKINEIHQNAFLKFFTVGDFLANAVKNVSKKWIFCFCKKKHDTIGLLAFRNRYSQTLQTCYSPFISGRPNMTFPTIDSVLMASLYWEISFWTNHCFWPDSRCSVYFQLKISHCMQQKDLWTLPKGPWWHVNRDSLSIYGL